MKRPTPKRLPAEKLRRERLNTLARAPKRLSRRELEQSLAGKMMSARRTRRIAFSLSVFSFVILGILVAVATFSPALAVREIIVRGTERIDSAKVLDSLKVHLGTPLPLLSEAEVAKSLSGFELIESFSATALPPNGLQISIVERQAICIIKIGTEFWLHDPAGVKLAKAKESDLLPEIVLNENPKDSEKFRNAIEVLMALPSGLLDEVETIEANSKDDVRMNLRSSKNQRIVWGDSSNSVLKSRVLTALMKNNRQSQSVTFDVSSPNAPVVRFDNF